ncbi:hypothetical protein MRB53_003719 [Persea americana]|uniref:Uncharacterized protein n=1 Tax=Persea americana TaxID=3435 RepID=A0ACC2MY75_PERAE|nr:hypothetical protein MRB53_003719 [Persea americana]
MGEIESESFEINGLGTCLSLFLLTLALELADKEKRLDSRFQARIILKNAFDAKDSVLKEQLIQQWAAIDLTVKNGMKNLLLKTLKSGVREAWHTSSQVIVEIASIEIPMNGWPDLIDHFLKNITMVENPASLKQAMIDTLAYVCQKVFPQNLEADQRVPSTTLVISALRQPEHYAMPLIVL